MTMKGLKKYHGFTMVELLVVVGVIAVLASMLFPVFAQAREKARASTCTSHLQGLTMAMLMYVQDYDEQLPLAVALTSTPPFFAPWHNLIDPYVRNKQVWLCPSSSIPANDADGSPTSHFGYNAYYLTKLERDFSNVGTTQTGVRMSAVVSPGETVVLTDAQASISGSRCGLDGKYLLPPSLPNTDCWGLPSVRHTDGCNVSWLDGHVQWRRLDQFYSGQNPTDRLFDLE